MEYIEELQFFFPLENIGDIINLVNNLIARNRFELSVLSIILGWYESQLTGNENKDIVAEDEVFPILQWDIFSDIYSGFGKIIEQCRAEVKCITDEKLVIKKISDVVWDYLANPYFKDKHHIQNIYSFLKRRQLDCFGVTITVLSLLKILGFCNIHLALSEDHAWLIYNNETESAEVTWYGKDNRNKRGQPISYGCDVAIEKCWLYLGGNYVNCDDVMEFVAIINAINPGINSKTDSNTLGKIQQNLLLGVYQDDHVGRFPIALCNLADLEEIDSSNCETLPSIAELYEHAIKSNEEFYSNSQVYPYTYYAGYKYRSAKYTQAIVLWTKASKVISRYNYSKEDEEAYKEFHEITNTLLVDAVKRFIVAHDNDKQIIAEIFVDIIKYFDNLCLWEEDSKTPVFHEEWARSIIKIISTFDNELRIETVKGFCSNVAACNTEENTVEEVQENVMIAEQVVNSGKMQEIITILSQHKFNKSALKLKLCACANQHSSNKDNSEVSGRAKRKRMRYSL